MPRLQWMPIFSASAVEGRMPAAHHDQVGRHLAAVLELHGHHAAVLVPDECRRVGADLELQAAILERLLQQLACHVVELPVHQPRRDVHHRDLHAAQHQPVGRFQAQQAAADHHRVLVARGGVDHLVGVCDVAIGDDALQVLAGQRRDEWRRAGRDQQPVVAFLRAVFGADDACLAIDVDDLLAEVQRDALLLVPGQRIEHDLVERLFAGQHGAQHDAVVVGVRLGAEHGDVVQVGRDLEQLFERAYTGHAVADHDELHLLHAGLRENMGKAVASLAVGLLRYRAIDDTAINEAKAAHRWVSMWMWDIAAARASGRSTKTSRAA